MSPCSIWITLALCYSNIPSQLLPHLLIPLGLCTSYSSCLILSSSGILRIPTLPSFTSLFGVKPNQRGFCDYVPLVPIPFASVSEPCFIFLIIVCHKKINMCLPVSSIWNVEKLWIETKFIIWRETLFCFLLYTYIQRLKYYIVGPQKIFVEWMSDALQEIKKELGLRIVPFNAAGVNEGQGEGWDEELRSLDHKAGEPQDSPATPIPSRRLKKGGLGLWHGRWGWVPQDLPNEQWASGS